MDLDSIGSSRKVTVGFSPPPLSISSDITLNGIVYPSSLRNTLGSWLLLENQVAGMARKFFAQIYMHYVLQLYPFLGWMVLSCPFTFNYLSLGQLQYSLQRAVLQVVQKNNFALHNSRCQLLLLRINLAWGQIACKTIPVGLHLLTRFETMKIWNSFLPDSPNITELLEGHEYLILPGIRVNVPSINQSWSLLYEVVYILFDAQSFTEQIAVI